MNRDQRTREDFIACLERAYYAAEQQIATCPLIVIALHNASVMLQTNLLPGPLGNVLMNAAIRYDNNESVYTETLDRKTAGTNGDGYYIYAVIRKEDNRIEAFCDPGTANEFKNQYPDSEIWAIWLNAPK